ncbi:MAG: ABC transporter permease [Ignavibacteriales bacterium]
MDFMMTLRTAWRSIIANKLRSSLTALGIIIGVGSVITMVALSQGTTAGITERISSMGTNILTIQSSGGFGAMRGSGGSTITMGDADALAGLPYIKNVVPQASTSGTLAIGSTTWQTSITGCTPEMASIKDWSEMQGDFFTQDDEDTMAQVMVMGSTVAENMSIDASYLGKAVTINNLSFTLQGILPEKGSDEDNSVYIPLSTTQQRLTGSKQISRITVQATKKEALSFLQDTITSLLRQRHRLNDSADDDFRIMDSAELLSTVEDTTQMMTMLLGGIAAISLLVGGIGVMNIMLVSVTERTKEIGIRMAIGATTREVLGQFLTEAVVLCSIGGIIGTLLGFGASWIFGQFTSFEMSVPPWSAVVAVGFSMLIGVVFGYYPAKQAAESDPIECLRYE